MTPKTRHVNRAPVGIPAEGTDCGAEGEMFSNEMRVRYPTCGTKMFRIGKS